MKKLLRFELRKIFSKRLTQISLILILLFSVVLGFSGYQNKYALNKIAVRWPAKAMA